MFCMSKQQLSSLRRLVHRVDVEASRHAETPGNMQELPFEQQTAVSLLTGVRWAVLAAASCCCVGLDVSSREAVEACMCSCRQGQMLCVCPPE